MIAEVSRGPLSTILLRGVGAGHTRDGRWRDPNSRRTHPQLASEIHSEAGKGAGLQGGARYCPARLEAPRAQRGGERQTTVQVVNRREGEGGGVKKREEEVGPAPHTQRRGVEGCGGERWEGTFQVETLWDRTTHRQTSLRVSVQKTKGRVPFLGTVLELSCSSLGQEHCRTLHLEWDTFLFWSEPKRLWAQLNFSHMTSRNTLATEVEVSLTDVTFQIFAAFNVENLKSPSLPSDCS